MPERALPYRPHNHKNCVAQALSDARTICQDENARLTPIRERVLELIWQSHKPLGAYDILGRAGLGWTQRSTANGLSGSGFSSSTWPDTPDSLT